jgi:DNA-binding NtrC family response regulator
MSGYAENEVAHHGVLELAVTYLQKPFTPETLISAVRQTLNA